MKSTLFVLLALSVSSRLLAVVISEVHYHPPQPDGRRLEFVELHNPRGEDVDLAGWQLERGVEFTFPEGASLPAGGYVVVAGNEAALRDGFGLAGAGIYGNFAGALDNAGDVVLLVDASGVYIDQLAYSDERPWPTAADGDGDSLQRLCIDAAAANHLNWIGAAPTPLAAAPRAACPPPAFVPGAVVINEIHYHPMRPEGSLDVGDDGEMDEYVELHNRLGAAVDVGGWHLTEGLDYEFPAGTVIAAGGYLLVGREGNALRNSFALPADVFVGGYAGRLSNGGERITLEDAAGNVVDSVSYSDSDEWSYAADGEGHSLERISAAVSGEDPANWSGSHVARDVFHRLTAVGQRGAGLAERFIVSLDGAGELIIDDVVLEDVSDPGVNLLPNADFESMLEGWTPRGNAARSVWEPQAGVGGTGALRLISDRPCTFECGSSNGVTTEPTATLNSTTMYRVTMMVKFVSGGLRFRGGLFRGVQATPKRVTPGAANGNQAAEPPPFVDHVGRFPRQPESTDATWLTAHVRGNGATQVTLSYSLGEDGDFEVLEMFDDGQHRDGRPGDAVYGQQLPAFPHNTQVRFLISAGSGDRTRAYPHLKAPGGALPEELAGYYVSDLPNDSVLPVYHILIDGVDGNDWVAVNNYLNCDVLRRASFAYRGDLYPDVGLRWRGNTACVIDKRNFKLRFNRSRFFRGVRKLNLNSQWTDKALVREHLAWQFIEELGIPAVSTEYVRVNVSGSYYGLYLCLEHPDQRFLSRVGLDAAGNLYKARQPPQGADDPVGVGLEIPGNYARAWEEETNEGGTYADIEEFITAMHGDAGLPGPSLEFWRDRSFPEMIMGFQITQVALHNFDSALKNHFLYHDLEQDRWGILTWDMDLVMGKFFDFGAVNVREGRQVGTLNDVMIGDLGQARVITPWFFTTLFGHTRFNYLVDFFFRAGRDYFHEAYLTRLWNVLEEKFNNRSMDPRIDDLVQLIFDEQLEDFDRWGRYPSNVPGFPEDMLSNVDIVKEQIGAQHDFLQSTIRALHPSIPEKPKLIVTEIMYLPEDGGGDLEFLELVNTSASEADLSRWSIAGGIRYTFPPRATAAPAAVVVVAKSPAALREAYPDRELPLLFGPYSGRLANEGETLEVLAGGAGHPAVVDRVAYGDGGLWPETPPGHSLQLANVTNRADNDRPEAWVVSAALGGDPGATSPSFIRGDANADDRVNITDAVFVLAHLFGAGEEPRCLDAADVNDDGGVNVADVVSLLNHLFRGRTAPRPPYPERGADPTADGLRCDSIPKTA